MKKIISILAIALVINFTAAKAQSSSTVAAPVATEQKETAASDVAKQCKGVTPACAKSCSSDKAKAEATTTTLSENYANAGSVPVADQKNAKSACSGVQSKSCCKGSSKASSINKDMKAAKSEQAIAPKEAETPKQ